MFTKFKNWLREIRLSLRTKMTLALSAIAIVLLMSSVISILEYRHMSTYVSDMIAGDIRNIRQTQLLIDAVDDYNLQILAVIGDDERNALPEFDRASFVEHCDSLRASFGTGETLPLADSVLYAYSAYMLASQELEDVVESNFINTRDWYFTRLQPIFGRLRDYLEALSDDLYQDLMDNSKDFDSGFFRSIIPSAVAVASGIVLILLLLFFILAFYVKPIYGMLDALKDYLSYRRRYTYTFDGNDQLGELNDTITGLTEENRALRRRLTEMKEKSHES